MRSSPRCSDARASVGRAQARELAIVGWRLPAAILARAAVLAAIVGLMTATLAASATAATPMQSSQNVALIPSNYPANSPGGLGVMPISSYVSGRPDESFDKFSFKYVALNNITPATLSSFDTAALIQVNTSDLSGAAKAALAQFVATGGKLIIEDSDETSFNDYSWLLPGPFSTKVNSSCNAPCGNTAGSSTITENGPLISGNSSDPSYVSIPELLKYTDAVGDSNLMSSDDPRWFAAAKGTNASGGTGAQLAYASNNGLIIYNGFDTDMIKPTAAGSWMCIHAPNNVCPANDHPSVDWLAQMWYAELNKSWGFSDSTGSPGAPNGLPQTTPVSSVGAPLPPTEAGLPSNHACVARRSLFLRLRRLGRHHGELDRVDVYLNGRHVLRESGSRLRNVTLRQLPAKGSVLVVIVARTKRGKHFISTMRYRACSS